MPCTFDHKTSTVQPAQDFNVQTPAAQSTGTANPPIPADHAQQTPEFLQKLIKQLNQLKQEQSVLYAKMYGSPHSLMSHEPPHMPPYEVLEEYRRQDREFDTKISALKMQIQELRTLLARPAVQPEPELEKAPAPATGA
jgi:predicted Rossmann fold nucleotide-binding protein DprA/Smf involved in DNA uptake